jgi:hypothetical protein
MTVINFAIPANLDKKVQKAIKEYGFTSKAEFFRFAALNFLGVVEAPTTDFEAEADRLSKEIEALLIKKFKGKKLPSLREQLDNI